MKRQTLLTLAMATLVAIVFAMGADAKSDGLTVRSDTHPPAPVVFSNDIRPEADEPAARFQAPPGIDDVFLSPLNDQYGYTWSSFVPYEWIDATDGTDTGMSGYSYGQAVGPIALPFTFDFYENSYAELYIAAGGYIAFTEQPYWLTQFNLVSTYYPNNVIVGYANYFNLAASGPDGRVYYQSGGVAPNRYFVIEWHNVSYSTDVYTFEIVLHENGDFDLVYADSISTYYGCGTSGMEDSLGWDGIEFIASCGDPPQFDKVAFYRPPDAYRAITYPPSRSALVSPGEKPELTVEIRNTGNFGADTFNLHTSALLPVNYFEADGVTPITDSDGDSLPDVVLAQGAATSVMARVTVPGIAQAGDHDRIEVEFRSAANELASADVTLDVAVPVPFANAYTDGSDVAAFTLQLAHPSVQGEQYVTGDHMFPEYPAVVATADGYLTVWTNFQYNGYAGGDQIRFQLVDAAGHAISERIDLTDHATATMNTYTTVPAVAVAPNGNFGFLWTQSVYDPETSLSNSNVFFALVDADGALLSGPTDITQNDLWGSYGQNDVPTFAYAQIAATSTGSFVLGWGRDLPVSGSDKDDIFYAVRDSGGAEIAPPTLLTDGVSDGNESYRPSVTKLSTDRVIVTFAHRGSPEDEIRYAVIDGAGSLIVPPSSLTGTSPTVDWWNNDVVELDNGNVLAVWEAWGCFTGEWTSRMRYVILDSGFNVVTGPECLPKAADPANASNNASIALAGDGKAAIVWEGDWDEDRHFYASVDSDGIATQPMQLRQQLVPGNAYQYSLRHNYNGYAITEYVGAPPAAADGMVRFRAADNLATPGGNAQIKIDFDNIGQEAATDVAVTVTLDEGLTYLDDSSGITPTVSAQTVSWEWSELAFLDGGWFYLNVGVDETASPGSEYDVSVEMALSQSDADPSNNLDSATVTTVEAGDIVLLTVNHVQAGMELPVLGGIRQYDIASSQWDTYFRGSPGSPDAFTLYGNGAILMSLASETDVPGIGVVEDVDLILYRPGSDLFVLAFDGSDVGLDAGVEDIDAIAIIDGKLAISTSGDFEVPGLSGGDEDLIVLENASFGQNTSGTWTLYFDGSNLGLGDAYGEDIYGAAMQGTNRLHLNPEDGLLVNGLLVGLNDIVRCKLTGTGSNTACGAGSGVFWRADASGFRGKIFAFDIIFADGQTHATLPGLD